MPQMVCSCAMGGWGGEDPIFVEWLGDISPWLVVQCALTIVQNLMVCLDNLNTFSECHKMKKTVSCWVTFWLLAAQNFSVCRCFSTSRTSTVVVLHIMVGSTWLHCYNEYVTCSVGLTGSVGWRWLGSVAPWARYSWAVAVPFKRHKVEKECKEWSPNHGASWPLLHIAAVCVWQWWYLQK